jgi:DNA-binding NtrC family response regulator
MTDDNLRQTARDLVDAGAFRYCRKPPSIRDLKIALRGANETLVLRQKLQDAEQRLKTYGGFASMVGMTDAMREVYELMLRVADVNAPVPIPGERVAGKELISRAIYKSSSREAEERRNVSRPSGELRQQADQPRTLSHQYQSA